MNAREVHAHKVHTCEVHANEIQTREVHTHEMHTYKVHAHETHACEMHAYEGFCEDLARQNTAAHLSQLQLGFRRCRILVMLSHMGFSHRCGVLKVSI